MIFDRPRIGLHMAEYHQSQTGDDDLDLDVPPFNPQDLTVSLAPHHELALSGPSLQSLSEMQQYTSAPEECSRLAAVYWGTDRPRPLERVRSHPFPSPFDGVNPLPYNLAIPRDASPDGWWAGDRPAIEHNPSAGESSQSALTSEDHPEMDMGPYRHHAPWGVWPAPYDCLGGCSPRFRAYESPEESGISLCEIEPFQDVDTEKLSGQAEPEMKLKHHYFIEPAPLTAYFRPPTSSSVRAPDEETVNSSIPEVDDDRIMEDDIRDEEGSDYTPPTPPKRSPRRGSSHSATATVHPSKRPVRSRNPTSGPSKPGDKITKRISAPKALAPTPSTARLASAKRSSVTSPRCPQCAGIYHSESALHKHTLASHTRPFVCTFRRYGCPSTFGSKNEWKRHVSSQHLRLGIYRCDMDKCVPQEAKPSHRRKSSSASHADGRAAPGKAGSYNDFNRKDLFTQHVRRMHGPAVSASGNGLHASDESLEAIRQRCWRPLRETPPTSVCGICPHVRAAPPSAGGADPARSPPTVWEGSSAWDERMEHVGRHLEKGEGGGEEDEDVGLREWMLAQGLLTPDRTGGWVVVGCGGRKRGKGVGVEVGGRMGLGRGIGTRRDVGPAAGHRRDEDMDGDYDDVVPDASRR